ncbi:MAG: hypothetical protein OER95_17815, partial [Acidimicrobiia bacterium]|nr:hypothetical protein [Acidimicrobiia bacterium]
MARRSTAPQPPRPAAGPMTGVALLALACALAGLAARATYGARTTADEPQYLLTALSLADDRDLDISNQIANGDHLPFHEIPIDRQTFPLDESGREVSPHDPLLPVILAPAMGLGGWVLAKVVLAVVAAAVAVGTLRLAGRER